MLIIEKNTNKIKALCKSHNVEKLYLFGSATNENFTEESDIDLLVSFKKFDLAKYFENYMTLKEKLKNIFKREIDLVEEQTLKNPILINSINKNKKLIYG
jgi:predicted nucleotidyltransferase